MRSFDRHFFQRPVAVIGLSAALLLTVLIALTQWQTMRDMRHTRDWVRHTREIQFALEYFRYCISTAESNQRGYLLTHDETYLNNYRKSLALDSEQFKLLRSLTADNPDEQKNLDLLEGFLNEKFRVMAQAIALEQNGDRAGALAVVNAGEGTQSMDGIIATVQVMQDTELNLLQQRQAVFWDKFNFNTKLSVVIFIFCLLYLLAVLVLVRRVGRLQADLTDFHYLKEGERMLATLEKNKTA